MRIAIIGTGRVAQALAAGWTKAGHDLTLGSRDPRAKQGLGVTVAGLADATGPADVVVNATPGASSLASLTQAGVGALDGKVLIDVANAVTDGGGLAYPDSSLAEELQKAFPTVTVVKALNTANTSVMTNPGALAPTTVFLSGDDAQAKARARRAGARPWLAGRGHHRSGRPHVRARPRALLRPVHGAAPGARDTHLQHQCRALSGGAMTPHPTRLSQAESCRVDTRRAPPCAERGRR